ncbi:MAG: hypothetical protein P9M14_04175 [Candidatus Alcyoniella australis]|nr:hypothetical protein [Candidatus Alcyoniella australis]
MQYSSPYKLSAIVLLLTLCAVLLFACGNGSDGDDDDDQVDDDGDDDFESPGEASTADADILPRFFRDRPWLQDRSLWSMQVEADNPPLLRNIGELGLGNGHTFSLLSTNLPLNSLHNISGPDYHKDVHWFSDKSLSLHAYGIPLAYEDQSAWRVRRTAINITRSVAGPLDLWTVDFAPLVEGAEAEKSLPIDAIVRICVVHNPGSQIVRDVRLKIGTVFGSPDGVMLHEENGDESIYVAHPGRQGWFEDQSLVLPVQDLGPGEEAAVPVVLAFVNGDQSPEPILNVVQSLGAESLLESTRDAWYAWSDQGAQVNTNNQRFDDLIEGLQVTIRAQQTAQGASAVMSEYGGTWIRDIMGPTVFFTPIGRSEDVAAMLDYYWAAALLRGNISNSMALDLDISELPAQPDWDAMSTMHGRTGAETPSYIVLQYRELYRATGDFTPLAERYGLLKHCLLHQDFRDDWLLPFSDDETYRLLMQAAYGMWFGDSMYETHLSSNSSFLYVPAALFAAEVARELGYEADAEQFELMAQRVRQGAEEHYWVDDPHGGYYASIVDVNTLEPWPQPYEDVATKPLWTGYAAPDDERAIESLLTLTDWFGRSDGTVISYTDPMYTLLMDLMGIRSGIFSGMSQGYVLSGLSAIDHPRAEQLFLSSLDVFGSTGNTGEAQVADDYGRFAYLWEPFGLVCDLTSRYRPWEGGIYGDALLDYLFGYRPDAPHGRAALTIHLPRQWDHADVSGLTYGQGGLDVEVSDSGGARSVVVGSNGVALEIELAISVIGAIAGLWIDGVEHDLAGYELFERWGVNRVTVPFDLAAGDSVEVEISYR